MKLLASYLAACNDIALGSTAAAQRCHDSPAGLRPAETANAAAEAVVSLHQNPQSSFATDISPEVPSK